MRSKSSSRIVGRSDRLWGGGPSACDRDQECDRQRPAGYGSTRARLSRFSSMVMLLRSDFEIRRNAPPGSSVCHSARRRRQMTWRSGERRETGVSVRIPSIPQIAASFSCGVWTPPASGMWITASSVSRAFPPSIAGSRGLGNVRGRAVRWPSRTGPTGIGVGREVGWGDPARTRSAPGRGDSPPNVPAVGSPRRPDAPRGTG